jgi:hypothetical protein
VHAAPDKQISLTDPDARSMATSGKDTGMVGYNVQAAVDAKHHLIVAHEVTNIGNDRSQLSTMAKQAQAATGARDLTAIADRGYFKGEEIVACEAAGVTPIVPKPLTSGAKADGRFGKQDFVYDPGADAYHYPGAGEADAAVCDRRSRPHAARLLDKQMRRLRNARLPNNGASNAESIEAVLDAMQELLERAQDYAHPTPDRRTSVWDHQGLDGRDPLPPAHP